MKRYLIPVAALALVACSGGDDDIEARYVPAETEEITYDGELEVLMLDSLWPQYELCSEIRQLTLTDEIVAWMIGEFEAGYGEPLTPTGRDHLEELIRAC